MRRAAVWAAALVLSAAPAGAQKLRDRIASLVTFGDWTVPLRVGTPGPDGRSVVASDIFFPGSGSTNAALLTFVTGWMQASAANAPISSTGGGTTFSFRGGTPVAQRVSPGPIFGEHATTLGRGAMLAGANYTGVRYSKVRGVPNDELRLEFTPTGGAAGTDALDLRVALDYSLAITSLYTTVGVLDRVDVGVVVPFVQAELGGVSTARVVSQSGGTPSVLIGGTPQAPLLTSRQSIGGRASGLGDVALRVKANAVDRPTMALGVLADVRFPTGDEADLLGSGSLSMRALGLYSARLGGFKPRVSAGYLYYADDAINDAFLATAGFDQDVAPWATLAVSLLSELHTGESAYQLPSGAPAAANIPAIRDDALSASAGFKVSVAGVRTVFNALFPVTRGGPRPDFAYTLGLERDF
jgi:hypothetical protein